MGDNYPIDVHLIAGLRLRDVATRFNRYLADAVEVSKEWSSFKIQKWGVCACSRRNALSNTGNNLHDGRLFDEGFTGHCSLS